MRILGLGLEGCKKFCGLMDFAPFLYQNTYDIFVKNMNECVNTVTDKVLSNAAIEEKQETAKAQNLETTDELTMSGDGTWHKRGFNSLYGVASLIGFYTGKIIDVCVKSAYCKECELWNKKKDTAENGSNFEYEEWFEKHKDTCCCNHEGSSGKMEVDAIVEMFQRSVERYGVKYRNYIGDGDSKTYSGILDKVYYGPDCPICKKECVGHVQKRMGNRLRNLVKNSVQEVETKNKKKIRRKILGGKGNLTAKLIDKLTVYYGLAIRRNCESIEKMRDAIWATFYHYSSTDKNPQHDKCPTGEDSWCEWQRAVTNDQLQSFKHSYDPLSNVVLQALRPVYEDLSSETLLERCVGGFNQNNNESYNQLIWRIAPKVIPNGSRIINIAANVAACVFNEGYSAHLAMLYSMGVNSGPNAHDYCCRMDAKRISIAERRAQLSTREARLTRRQRQADILDNAEAAADLLYGPGIDDSMYVENNFIKLTFMVVKFSQLIKL